MKEINEGKSNLSLLSPSLIDKIPIKSEFNIPKLICSLFVLWFPIFIQQFAYNASILFGSQVISSNLPEKDYDAVGLGIAYTLMVAFFPFYNLSSALLTLVSQAFGRKDYIGCMQILSITNIILLIFSIILSIFFVFGNNVLYLFVKDPDIIPLLYRYCLTFIPLIILMNLNSVILTFFGSVLQVVSPMIIIIFGSILLPIICYLMIFYLEMGYLSYLYSTIVVNIGQISALLIIFIFSKSFANLRVKPKIFVKESWISFLKLGIPPMIVGTIEDWSISILLLVVGRLETKYIAANMMLYNLFYCINTISAGIGSGVANLVGNSFGDGNSERAKNYIKIGAFKSAGLTIILILSLYFVRGAIARFFFKEKDIIEVFINAFPFFLLCLFVDSFHWVFKMAIIGMGRQVVGSIMGCVSGLILLGFGYLFMFYFKYNIKGFWSAFFLYSLIISIGLFIVLICSDFTLIAKNASKRKKEIEAYLELKRI